MDHYTKSLPYELELTSRVLHEATSCFFEINNFAISPEEFAILDCIYMNPDIIQMELAKLILKGRAHTGKFLKSLEEKNFIRRYPEKISSKIVMKIEITSIGLETYKSVCSRVDEFVKNTASVSKTRINDLLELLRLIRQDAINSFNVKFE